MKIDRLDHLVLTVASLEATVAFYTRVMGMEAQTFGGSRKALKFGQQKINLHEVGHEIEPKSRRPTVGSADLCFIVDCSPLAVLRHLESVSVPIEEGPVKRTGATGAITSIYIRDPDGNLIELSSYDE